MNTIEVKEIRKALRPLGFTIKTQQFSEFRSATICDRNGIEMPMIFTKDLLEYWSPAILLVKKLIEGKELTHNNQKIIGLK